jgi:PAS domain S-box-containing protein
VVIEVTRQAVDNPVTRVLREGTVVGLANQTLLLGRNGVARPIDDSGAPIHDAQGQLLGAVLVFRDITERRRAEAARTQLAAIVESADDAIISKTMAGLITSWNRAAERLYGYPAAEMIGQPIAQLIPPDLADDFPMIMARLRRGERIEHYETQRLAKDGTRIDVSLTISPLRDSTGQIIGASKIARDITERRQAEAARAQLAAIVESADDAILGITLAGLITSWNRAAERLYGYTAAEMLGQPIAQLIPPDLADDLPMILARLRRGERIEQYETQRLAKDGTRLDVALTISPLRDHTGQIIGASKIVRDITARKQAEAELARRRQETALLTDIAQGLSASLELETVFQRIVTGAQELCGSARVLLALREPGTDTLVGRYASGVPPLAATDFQIAPGQGLGGQVLRTGRPWRTADYATDPRFSKDFLARAQAAGHLAVLAVPIRMAARVEGLLYASNPASRPFTDRDEALLVRLAAHAAVALQNAHLYQQTQAELAARQRAEAALVQAAAELEQRVADRTAALQHEMAERQRLAQEAQRLQHFALLGRLAAGVSHEIRNPLGAIFLHADLLEEELRDPSPESAAQMAEALAEIKQQLARLDDLVQDYLSLVRVAHIERTPQDLGAAVRAWATEWQALATAHGSTLQCAGLDALGVVALHANTLRRALLNLVQNALEAMPQGGTLTLEGRRRRTTVELDVGDTGSGIPPDQQARIFEPLHTTKPGGTGLGLYIVQEVVAAHGGQVTVQSVAGQGSTFTITLPLPDPPAAP